LRPAPQLVERRGARRVPSWSGSATRPVLSGSEVDRRSVSAAAGREATLIPQEDDLTENVVREGGMLLALLVHFLQEDTRSFPCKSSSSLMQN